MVPAMSAAVAPTIRKLSPVRASAVKLATALTAPSLVHEVKEKIEKALEGKEKRGEMKKEMKKARRRRAQQGKEPTL